MGTTHVAGGAITFTSPSALCRRSMSSPWIVLGGRLRVHLRDLADLLGDRRRDAREVVDEDLLHASCPASPAAC